MKVLFCSKMFNNPRYDSDTQYHTSERVQNVIDQRNENAIYDLHNILKDIRMPRFATQRRDKFHARLEEYLEDVIMQNGDNGNVVNVVLILLYYLGKIPGIRVYITDDDIVQIHSTDDNIDPMVTYTLQILVDSFIENNQLQSTFVNHITTMDLMKKFMNY